MLHTDFSLLQITLLILSSVCALSSYIFHTLKKEKIFFLFLFLTAFSVFSFAALLTPFLNLWDERFHALVAKNMVNNPLMPTLYANPIVDMAYDSWDRAHIWLHKQPLFLWQIAASFSLFGFSEFALRLPSIILGCIFVLVVYRSGQLLINRRAGLVAAFLVLSSLYITELIGGRQPVDHNDIAFLSYVSLSIWALLEYYFSRHKKWIVLIGLFSGLAILCKWLTGLLVYAGWGILWLQEYRWKITAYKPIFLSLLITITIALPWQIFILLRYPTEALREYAYNSLHFTEAVEGHSGSWYFHIEKFSLLYGSFSLYLIIPALVALYFLITNKKIYVSLLGMIGLVYVFFSLAATKMPAFVLIVALPLYLAFAALFEYIFQNIEHLPVRPLIQGSIIALIITLVAVYRYDIQFLNNKYSSNTPFIQRLSANKRIFTSLSLPPNSVLFNVPGRHYVDAMFYTGVSSYNFVPTKSQYDTLKQSGIPIAIISTSPADLPDYLKNDPDIRIIGETFADY